MQAAVKHSFRALEVTCPRPGELHPHFHVLLVVPGAYLEPHSPLYITQADWAAMWRKAAIAGSASDSGHAERWLENAHEGTV